MHLLDQIIAHPQHCKSPAYCTRKTCQNLQRAQRLARVVLKGETLATFGSKGERETITLIHELTAHLKL